MAIFEDIDVDQAVVFNARALEMAIDTIKALDGADYEDVTRRVLEVYFLEDAKMTEDDLEALPMGTMIKCHWPDDSHPDQIVIRCNPNSGASSGGFSFMADRHWTEIANWGAEIEVLYIPESEV